MLEEMSIGTRTWVAAMVFVRSEQRLVDLLILAARTRGQLWSICLRTRIAHRLVLENRLREDIIHTDRKSKKTYG